MVFQSNLLENMTYLALNFYQELTLANIYLWLKFIKLPQYLYIALLGVKIDRLTRG
jgi:hypothetical protein